MSIIVENSRQVKQVVNLCVAKLKKGAIEVSVKLYRPSKTVRQLALWWRWLRIIEEHTGYTAEELNHEYNAMFTEPIFIRDDVDGYHDVLDLVEMARVHGDEKKQMKMEELRRKHVTKKKFNVDQMREVLNKLDQHAASFHGCSLPLPSMRGLL